MPNHFHSCEGGSEGEKRTWARTLREWGGGAAREKLCEIMVKLCVTEKMVACGVVVCEWDENAMCSCGKQCLTD